MKKLILSLFCMMFSYNANAVILSPHVGIDYVGSKPNSFDLSEYSSVSVNAGIKILSFISVEGYYQEAFSIDAEKGHTNPSSYGVDVVGDLLNLGVVELLSSVGYGQYNLSGGELNKHQKDYETGAFRVGLGGQINLTNNLGIRAMYRYVMPDSSFVDNIQEISVGLRFYFF